MKNTSGGWRTGQLLEVLECNRHTEGKHNVSVGDALVLLLRVSAAAALSAAFR